MRARIIGKSSAARGRARSRRSSSMRARIVGKSSAARGRITSPPFPGAQQAQAWAVAGAQAASPSVNRDGALVLFIVSLRTAAPNLHGLLARVQVVHFGHADI